MLHSGHKTTLAFLLLVALLLSSCLYTPAEMRKHNPRTIPKGETVPRTAVAPDPVNPDPLTYPIDPPATPLEKDCIFIAQVFNETALPEEQRLLIDYVQYKPYVPAAAGGSAPSPVVDGVPVKVGVVTWIIRTVRHSLGIDTKKCVSGAGPEECIPRGIEAVYKKIVNSAWKKVVSACMMLMIIFYGISLVFGVVSANPYQIFTVVFKMILAWFLLGTGDKSWDYFIHYVYNTVETFVDSMSHNLSSMFGGAAGENPTEMGADYFNVADEFLSRIFSFNYIKLTLALGATGWFGWAYALALLGSLVAYGYVIIFAVRVYLMALVARNILYALTPIFLTFILFKETKSLFDNWMAQLISFTLQPIMLFAFLGMFHAIMYSFFSFILEQEQGGMICYALLAESMTGSKGQALYFWQIFTGTDMTQPPLSGPLADPPVDMLMTFSLIVLMGALTQMARWTEEAAYRISGGFTSAMNQFPTTWETFMLYRTPGRK